MSGAGDGLRQHWNPLIERMSNAPKPIIAAVQGPAVGVGFAITLACDIVMAAQSANFVPAFVAMGAIPDAGSTWLLPQILGHSRAMAIMLSGESLQAERAREWGLVHQVFPDEEFPEQTRAFALRFAQGPTSAYSAIKRLLRDAHTNSLSVQLQMEAAEQDGVFRTRDHRAAVAAFLDKGSVEFSGI